MKNRVVKNFLVFVGFWLLITVGMNFFQHRALLTNFPWEVLLLFLLSLIPLVSQLSRKVYISIDFAVFFVFMILTGGYYNWTSLIVFALMSAFMTVITLFISNQFQKGQRSK